MLITEKVNQKWNSRNKKHFVNAGYTFTAMKDEFEVNVADLTKGSNVKVKVRCDYCGKEYEKNWYNYLLENQGSYIHKDCCNECKKYKIQEVTNKKYGVNSVFQLDEIKEKIEKTNIDKYGVTNPFASDKIKEKIVKTNVEKYGVTNPLKSPIILEKLKATCQERYGVDYFIMTQVFSGEQSPRWKGGVSNERYERLSEKYKSWRKCVFDNDFYTCCCCGESKGNLNAHHIFNWKDYPEKRYDVNNGITLCETCHIKFHSIYGKKCNTQIQLTNFLNDYGKKIC